MKKNFQFCFFRQKLKKGNKLYKEHPLQLHTFQVKCMPDEQDVVAYNTTKNFEKKSFHIQFMLYMHSQEQDKHKECAIHILINYVSYTHLFFGFNDFLPIGYINPSHTKLILFETVPFYL